MDILQETHLTTEIKNGWVFVVTERVIRDEDGYKTVKHRASHEADSKEGQAAIKAASVV